MAQPDELVLNAFRATHRATHRDARSDTHRAPAGYAWDNGWRIGEVVYSHAASYAGWSAKIRDQLTVAGVRLARPVLATDGRYVVGGWKATQWLPGSLARRIDETVQVALQLDSALAAANATVPGGREDVFAQAEVAAWNESGEYYRPVAGPLLPGHADLLGTTIYQGNQPPAITDLVPTAAPRPRGYSAALVVVDGLINDAVDAAICDRFGHIQDFDQLLLRAVAFRRYLNSLHPGASAIRRSKINAVEDMLVSRVSVTLER